MTPEELPPARPAKAEYRRNLPHLQVYGKAHYVTFCTHDRWQLPPAVRDLVLSHCLHDHSRKVWVHGVVVMPDHVHMVLSPLEDPAGAPYGLAEILGGIKGASAHSVNRLLGRQGHVWQDESLDHVLRSDESVRQKVEYVCRNPVRKGLAREPNGYRWLWRDWAEGAAGAAGAASVAGVAQPPPAVEAVDDKES